MEPGNEETAEVKYVVGSNINTTGSIGSGTPGRYVRRLNAVETELREYRDKYNSLEKRFAELAEWKGKLDAWLMDAFEVAISTGSGSCVPRTDHKGGENGWTDKKNQDIDGRLAHQPLLTPKFESEETHVNVTSQKLANSGSLHNNEKDLGEVTKKRDPAARDYSKKTLPVLPTQNGFMVPPPAIASTSQKSRQAIPEGSRSSSGVSRTNILSNNMSTLGPTTFSIGSNITLEITKTPAIELERCDSKDGSQSPRVTPSHRRRPTVPAPSPKAINSTGNENDNVTESDEISIVFSSPSLPAVGPHEIAQIMDTMSSHNNSNVSVGALIPEVELIEGHEELSNAVHNQQERRDLFHLETDDPTPCAVCGVVDPEPQNEMIFCDECGLCVHQGCYGVGHIPSGGWKCSPCAVGQNPSELQCYFCPGYGGALKPVKCIGQRLWAHMSCAMWIPEVKPENEYTLEPICGINKIPKDRWKLKCSLCKTAYGACIQCQFSKRCTTAFHVTCAMKHGLEMKEIVPTDGTSSFILQAFCKAHTYRKKTVKKKPSSGTTTSDKPKPKSKKKRHDSAATIERQSPRKKKKMSNSSPARITSNGTIENGNDDETSEGPEQHDAVEV